MKTVLCIIAVALLICTTGYLTRESRHAQEAKVRARIHAENSERAAAAVEKENARLADAASRGLFEKGMTPEQIAAFWGKPLSRVQNSSSEGSFETIEYPFGRLYFTKGRLFEWHVEMASL